MNYEHWMIGVAFLTIANVIWTISLLAWNRQKVTVDDCAKLRSECTGDRVMARTTDSETKVITEVLEQVREELEQSKLDRKNLFTEVNRSFSILGDLAMAIQIISAKQLKEEPETMGLVLELIRKGKK